jgi:hypothetical protein
MLTFFDDGSEIGCLILGYVQPRRSILIVHQEAIIVTEFVLVVIFCVTMGFYRGLFVVGAQGAEVSVKLSFERLKFGFYIQIRIGLFMKLEIIPTPSPSPSGSLWPSLTDEPSDFSTTESPTDPSEATEPLSPPL